mmetsp:Transcript_33122/g.43619  ORF Transcript_33122/g.43619 Transcript_33122/m.43619 type:complete len:151 (+) Transcript_33122:74-526(+)
MENSEVLTGKKRGNDREDQSAQQPDSKSQKVEGEEKTSAEPANEAGVAEQVNRIECSSSDDEDNQKVEEGRWMQLRHDHPRVGEDFQAAIPPLPNTSEISNNDIDKELWLKERHQHPRLGQNYQAAEIPSVGTPTLVESDLMERAPSEES